MRHLVSPAVSQRESNLRSGEPEHIKASEVSWELFVGSDASLFFLVSEWPRREAIVWWQCLAVNKPRYLATPPTDCVRNSILQIEKRLFFLSFEIGFLLSVSAGCSGVFRGVGAYPGKLVSCRS